MKTKPTLSPYLYKDKTFQNVILFPNPCIRNFKFEDDDGSMSYEWLPVNKFKSVYDIMKECPDYMYISSGLTARCYTMINIDIDYTNYNLKFLEIIKKLNPSCILRRKSNNHLQIQFQGSYNRLMPHSLSYTHKSWQEGMNEIIYKISRYCKLNWQLSELNRNNSTTCQNVYHQDFERLYFNPLSRALEWFNYSTGKFDYFDKRQINFLVQNSIHLYLYNKPLPLSNESNENEIDYEMHKYTENLHIENENENSNISKDSPLIENTNDKLLVEHIRNYVWDYMRKNDKEPDLDFIYSEALTFSDSFTNSNKSKSEIKAVSRCSGLWAIRHFKRIHQNQNSNEIDFVKIYKESKLFVRFCFAIYGNGKTSRMNLSRYRKYPKDKILSIYQSALKFKSYANKINHSELLQDIDKAIILYLDNNSNNFIQDIVNSL